VTGTTDLYQLAIHDRLGLPEIAPTSDRDWFSFIEEAAQMSGTGMLLLGRPWDRSVIKSDQGE